MKRQGNKKKQTKKQRMKANFHLSVLQSDRLVSCIAFHFLLLPAVFQRDFHITQVKKVLSIQYKHHAEIT